MRRYSLPVFVLFLLIVGTVHAEKDERPASDSTSEGPVFDCPKSEEEPTASYVGPNKGYDSAVSAMDVARDYYCASTYKNTHYPSGFVTVFGSSRLDEYIQHESLRRGADASEEEHLKKEFNATYVTLKTFAHMWTMDYGKRYPILTGAGPGLMEAASRGAMEAGGPSVGYTTYYAPGTTLPHSAKGPLFARYNKEFPITSTGLVFSTVSARETAMITHSAAMVFAPGGTGTHWEIFQTLEMVKSKELPPIPIYFLGSKENWESLEELRATMIQAKTIKAEELVFRYAECAQDLENKLAHDLGLSTAIVPSSEYACKSRSTYEEQARKELQM